MGDSSQADKSLPLQLQLSSAVESFSSTTQALFLSCASRTHHPLPFASSTSLTSKPSSSQDHDSAGKPLVLLHELSALDKRLAQLVHLSETHQANQRRITALLHKLRDHDRAFTRDIDSLYKADERMSWILDKGKADIATILKVASSNVDLEQVLSFGRRLAPFSSAPPNFAHLLKPSSEASIDLATIPPEVRPSLPFPSEESMRRGVLAADAPVSDYGEDHKESPLGEVKQMDVQENAKMDTSRPPAMDHRPVDGRPRPPDTGDLFDLDI